MAYKGKIINNKKTGQQITFIQTADDTCGDLLEMESLFQPNSTEPVPHYHPSQEEYFTVLEGEICVRINDGVKILRHGEKLKLKKNQVHSMWNHSSNIAIVNWKVMPSLDTEYFLENGIGIANEKKTNEKGMPGLLQVVLLANRFSHVYRVAKPSYIIQKLLFTVLTPFSYLAGYRPCYKKFVD
jgi:mannose-6-phosphate isomerase-like protein (cupin superfamily)